MQAILDRHVSGSRLLELESLRGIAALLVVLYHIPRWNPVIYDMTVVRNGYLMVDLFFVLSGFVIHRAYGAKLGSGAELLRFQFLRFARLYPVHLLFLLFFVVIELGRWLAAGSLNARSEPFSQNSLTALVQQIFLVQAIGPTGNASTFNVPAWSISVEFYTYLLFGLVLLFARRASRLAFAVLAAASLVALMTRALPGYEDLLHCFAGFFIGCLTAQLVSWLPGRVDSRALPLVAAAFMLFLALKTDPHLDPVVYLFSAALIVAIANSTGGLVRQLLRSRPLLRLGTISYSVYMCHSAVLWVFNFALGKLLKRPEVMLNGQVAPQLATGEALVCYGLVAAAVVILSNVVYERVEKPVREWSRRVTLLRAPVLS